MKMLRSALQEGVGGGADKWQQTLHAEHRMNVFPDYPSHPGSWGSLCNWHILCAGILALNFNLICFSLIYLAEQEGSRYGQWKTENEKVKWTMLVKSPRSRCKAGCIALRSMNLELSPKSFTLICEYLDWRRPGVPVLQKKKHIGSITHQMCWFSGTGGDRTLDQQAISLPSGRITHNWTDSMQRK